MVMLEVVAGKGRRIARHEGGSGSQELVVRALKPVPADAAVECLGFVGVGRVGVAPARERRDESEKRASEDRKRPLGKRG